MNIKNIFVAVVLGAMVCGSAYAGDVNSANNANSSASTQSTSGSYNGGNNIITNNPGTVAYSGSFTQRNVPTVAMGSFSNSFSSDYCSGTMQATLGFAGGGLGLGKQKLDQGCQLLRSADMTMRIAQVYAADAAQAWDFAKNLGPAPTAQVFAQQVRETSFKKAAQADALKQASVNMVCAISDEVRKAMVDAAVDCPKK